MSKPKPERQEPAHDTLARRLTYILSQLHLQRRIDKHALAKKFSVDVRTIERDLHQRLRGIAQRDENGQWQLTHQGRGAVSLGYLQRYAELAGATHLLPDESLDYLLAQLDTPAPRRGLQVHPTPGEDLSPQRSDFATLQTAVQQRTACTFLYKNKPRQVHPYRLANHSGIWYLTAYEPASDKVKSFAFALIHQLQTCEGPPFAIPKERQQYLAETEGEIWLTTQTQEVTLRVAAPVAHYFSRRPLLPRQLIREQSDGSLLVTTHIRHPRQLLPIVQYWLPHVRILAPAELHQQLIDTLQQALRQWDA
ncbi:MAG: helix-turn-helix transcriptional regulator, partial [Ottowia sp.]